MTKTLELAPGYDKFGKYYGQHVEHAEREMRKAVKYQQQHRQALAEFRGEFQILPADLADWLRDSRAKDIGGQAQ